MTRQERPERRLSAQIPPEATTEPIARSGALVEALERLETAVTQIQDSETFRVYLNTQARFHRYSWGNVLLIVSQRPDATRVAGYRRWRELERHVRHGEHGIKILVPMRVRARPAAEPEEREQTPEDPQADHSPLTHRLLFKVGTVFDLSQTEGKPLPTIDVPVLEGDEGQDLYTKLERVAAGEGITIERGSERLRPTTIGFYLPDERRIVVREASPRQMTKTLAHELAHHVGGATAPSLHEETVAESVAYVT